eukprot:TRINITY_DN67056_c5_g4_i2.p1 TRINITY_DN67056_c5_g4~~TRINITY_DN67056_c5_g4_i2.p1  ORF type:complete len:265 (+),score=84.92 TRINITY_DN67056_c5_g4_i2:3-797(+)
MIRSRRVVSSLLRRHVRPATLLRSQYSSTVTAPDPPPPPPAPAAAAATAAAAADEDDLVVFQFKSASTYRLASFGSIALGLATLPVVVMMSTGVGVKDGMTSLESASGALALGAYSGGVGWMAKETASRLVDRVRLVRIGGTEQELVDDTNRGEKRRNKRSGRRGRRRAKRTRFTHAEIRLVGYLRSQTYTVPIDCVLPPLAATGFGAPFVPLRIVGSGIEALDGRELLLDMRANSAESAEASRHWEHLVTDNSARTRPDMVVG